MRVEKIFTPNRYPEHTYVKQSSKDLEQNLRRGLNTPGEILSLAGPSKSGKTVLVQNVVDEDSLILIQGSGIKSPEDLWNAALDQLGAPASTELEKNAGGEVSSSTSAKVKAWLGALGGEAGGEMQTTLSGGLSETEIYKRSGLKQVVEYIVDNGYTVLVDDFHYIDRSVQEDIAEEIKEAARRDISICVALVPHRSDDLVRANSDLRGRVQTLNVGYWEPHDLEKIAKKGFEKLRIQCSDEVIYHLAKEAAGSPQLMQRLCLELCYEAGIDEVQPSETKVDIGVDEFKRILNSTVEYADHASTFDVLDSGPKTRGTERKMYQFESGEGDVYRCILRAMASNPPTRSFTYEELKNRTADQCVGDESPSGSSIVGSCKKMDELVKDSFPDERAVEWDDAKQSLHIPDPYLLFYLRWSDRLDVV